MFLMVGLVLIQYAHPCLHRIQLRIDIPKIAMSLVLLLEVRFTQLGTQFPRGAANIYFPKIVMRNCLQVAQSAHVPLALMSVLHLSLWRPILAYHQSVAFRQMFLVIQDFPYSVDVIL